MYGMDNLKSYKEQYQYYESNGKGEVILLLHGLMGNLSNFDGIINRFGEDYNVVMPLLPLLTWPFDQLSLPNLVDFIEEFVDDQGYDKVHILGNSLGGHLAQLYTLKRAEKVSSLILTGSSGLFENSFGSTFPKRGDYEFIKHKVETTFYDPKVATKEIVDEVFETVTDREKALRVVITAKSAVRQNLENKIDKILAPTLLVWGKQDNVTPPFVAEKFHELIPNSTLRWVDKCGHAPMMEHPNDFNVLLEEFLSGLD